MAQHLEYVVCGLGAYGSAVLCELARRGCKVAGIDRWAPPHAHGSSHGESRITRLAIGEGDECVQFALRSHELWRRLESESGQSIMQTTGGLIVGEADDDTAQHGQQRFLSRTIKAAERFGIEHEVLGPAEARRRFPPFKIGPRESAYFEREAGVLCPERAIGAMLESARSQGADLRLGERIESVRCAGAGVEIRTGRGVVSADRAIVCAGPWTAQLAPQLSPRLRVLRQVLHWFDDSAAPELYAPDAFPIFIWLTAQAEEMLYGFPAIDGPGRGVKIASELYGKEDELADPDTERRAVSPEEERHMSELVQSRFDRIGPPLRHTTCLYTCTPDFRFAMGPLPEQEAIYCVSACSGHGFKHSAGIGEAIAELLTSGRSEQDLSVFPLAGTKP